MSWYLSCEGGKISHLRARFHRVSKRFSNLQHAPLVAFQQELSNHPSCAGPYTFQRFEAWDMPGLQPDPSNAVKLLHRLAADRGIVGVMTQHR